MSAGDVTDSFVADNEEDSVSYTNEGANADAGMAAAFNGEMPHCLKRDWLFKILNMLLYLAIPIPWLPDSVICTWFQCRLCGICEIEGQTAGITNVWCEAVLRTDGYQIVVLLSAIPRSHSSSGCLELSVGIFRQCKISGNGHKPHFSKVNHGWPRYVYGALAGPRAVSCALRHFGDFTLTICKGFTFMQQRRDTLSLSFPNHAGTLRDHRRESILLGSWVNDERVSPMFQMLRGLEFRPKLASTSTSSRSLKYSWTLVLFRSRNETEERAICAFCGTHQPSLYLPYNWYQRSVL